MDEGDLLAGQNFQQEIDRAIKNALAVIVCLSSKWGKNPRYVHKELRLSMEAMQKIPQGQIFTIPVKLDSCDVPEILKDLHSVNLYEKAGYENLVAAIRSKLDTNRRNNVRSAEPSTSESGLQSTQPEILARVHVVKEAVNKIDRKLHKISSFMEKPGRKVTDQYEAVVLYNLKIPEFDSVNVLLEDLWQDIFESDFESQTIWRMPVHTDLYGSKNQTVNDVINAYARMMVWTENTLSFIDYLTNSATKKFNNKKN